MRVFAIATIYLFVLGCASIETQHRALSQTDINIMRNAEIYLILPQDEIDAEVTPASLNGFGLLGNIINDREAVKTREIINTNLAKLRSQTKGLDFRKKFVEALQSEQIFGSTSKLNIIRSAPESEEALLKLVASAKTTHVVVMRADYMLDAWYRVLFIRTSLSTFERGKDLPVNTPKLIYYSMPVTSELEMPITGKFADLWTVNNARKYSAALDEGIREMMRLMHIKLTAHPATATTQQKSIRFYDWESQRAVKRNGINLQQNGNRAVVMKDDGALLSIPTGPSYIDAAEPSRPIQPSMGRAYFFTAPGGMVGIDPSLIVDGKIFGTIGKETYVAVDLPLGKHTFALTYQGKQPGSGVAKTQMEKVEPLNIELNDGDRYYLRFSGYKGVFTSSNALQTVTGAEAEKEVGDFWTLY